MNSQPVIESTINFVKENLQGEESGHDWWHIYRVWKNTCRILQKEQEADPLVCELGALLHDLADHKFHRNADEIIKKTEGFLSAKGLDNKRVMAVSGIMSDISFSKSIDNDIEKSLELKIVQDADRLDAMGAIGIARTFNYGGYKNRKMYDPDILPRKYSSASEYNKSESPTINHFYEKLLLLKDMMNTDTAMKMAEERHNFMLRYLDEFFKEWNSDD